MMWCLDVIVNFRTGFVDAGGMVLSPWRIAHMYARTWLAFDFLTSVPLTIFPSGTDSTFIGVLRAMKLLRVARIGALFQRLQQGLFWTGLVNARIGFAVVMLSHMLACGWRLATF